MTSGKNQSKLPKWFKGEVYPKGDTVKNPFSGEICKLNAEELSMYDYIIGVTYLLEMNADEDNFLSNKFSKLQNEMMKGLDWFRKNNSRAYMILLD